MWTSSYTENLTDGCWSPTRPSVFFTTRMDGCLDAWDILYQQRAPLLSIKVSDDPLHTLKVHEGGCLVATGCEGGNVALLELAEGLASAHRNDKTSVTAVSLHYNLVPVQFCYRASLLFRKIRKRTLRNCIDNQASTY